MSQNEKIDLATFQARAEAAGYRFVCPMCSNVASPHDFVKAGVDGVAAGDRAATECIGRTMNPMPKPKNGRRPCNWAAYGLFGNLGKGLIVVMPNGKEVQTFAIAEPKP